MIPNFKLPDVVYIHQVAEFEPWNTLAGALVGGLISLLITFIFHLVARRQEARDREQTRKLKIYSVYIKLLRLLNHGHAMRQMYQSFLDVDRLSLNAFHRMPAAQFSSLSIDSWKAEELVPFSTSAAPLLVNDLVELEVLIRAIDSRVAAFSDLKLRLTDQIIDLSGNFDPETSMTELVFDPKQHPRLASDINIYTALAKGLLVILLDFEEARRRITAKFNTFTSNDENSQVQTMLIEWPNP